MSSELGGPVINSITCAVKQKEMVALTTAPDGSLKIRPLGLFARIWHWNDTKFHEERLSKLASVVAKVISIQERLSIAAATEDPILKTGRSLLKECRYYGAHSPEISLMQKEITAAKLGISSITLDSNVGLQKFTETHHLERYLYIYKDNIQVASDTREVLLRKEGKLQPWKEISEDSKSWAKPTHSPHLAWVYGQEGIQNTDMYEWSELKPFMKGNPADWDHQYVFEFCACHNPNSIKNGVHSWFRLKTPAGDIYSVGLYRPDKAGWTDNLSTPFRIKPGHLMQPDVSEFWDFEITAIDFAITEEVFLKIKQTVEEDKKNEDQVFQLFNNNCVLYNKKLARIGGVDLPTLDNVLFFIVPENLAKCVSKFMDKLPSFVQKISLFVSAFFINLVQIFLGACMIDKDLNEQQRKKAVPHLNSFTDLFDVNKIYLNHPNTLGYKTRQNVLDWRKQEIEALVEIDLDLKKEQEKKINLSLPPAYYCKA